MCVCADVVFIKKKIDQHRIVRYFPFFIISFFFSLHTALSVPGKVITHTDIKLSLFCGLWMMVLAL